MKFVAYRIDTTCIKESAVVKGYFVRGQRSTDYNWPLLAEFDSMDAAKKYIKSICTDPLPANSIRTGRIRNSFIIRTRPGGYEGRKDENHEIR